MITTLKFYYSYAAKGLQQTEIFAINIRSVMGMVIISEN
ncbi:Uncharacterised protein [Escherichia coli]|uniref:Uncharacterized protein n=1 Tax=Escherichia coli TaxID=562 RepID=A0A377CVA1_ECOLX|nr:Uncharacterised protein [Escherichia coli]